MQGYCVKCRAKQEMTETNEVVWKNGRRALEGKCAVCGTKMAKVLGKA